MPIRHSTHQLEDASRRRFDNLLPAAWVVRAKYPDYGIDLEVEIFDEDGTATGLIFGAQLRATDDIAKRLKLSIEIDQLGYFDSLDLPTAIVRYCRADDTFHFRWHFLKDLPALKEGQKTVTLHFIDTDQWTDETPEAVKDTLTTLRKMRGYPRRKPILVAASFEGLGADGRYEFEAALHNLTEIVQCLALQAGRHQDLLSINVHVTPKFITVGFGDVSSFTFEIADNNREQFLAVLLYGIAALLGRSGLDDQASQTSEAIIANEIGFHGREIAAKACQALSRKPKEMVDLAFLNSIQNSQDIAFVILQMALIAAEGETATRLEAASRFYKAAAANARKANDVSTEATIHYSLANFYLNSGELRLAIGSYNRVRKLWPGYQDRQYFCLELGGCLFCVGRYKLASKIYSHVIEIGEDAVNDVRLGDALLFDGQVADAKSYFLSAGNVDDNFQISMEAQLKAWLCERIEGRIGGVVPTKRSSANHLVSGLNIESTLALEMQKHVIFKVDAFNPLANFNTSIAYVKSGHLVDALIGFLIVSFQQIQDTESWANTITTAYSLGESELFMTVLKTAISMGGRETYDEFRGNLINQGVPEEGISHLDELARQLMSTHLPSE